MSESLAYYLEGLLATGVLLELRRQVGGELGRARSRILASLATGAPLGAFLLLLATQSSTRMHFSALIGACASALITAGLVRGLGLDGVARALPTLAGMLVLVLDGILVQYLTVPPGQLLYLRGLAPPITLLYMGVFAALLHGTRLLPGLFEGSLALVSYLFLGSLTLQAHEPAALRIVSLAFAGVTTALWIEASVRGQNPRSPAVDTSWVLIAVTLSVLATAKRLVLVSIVPVGLLILAPVCFFTFLILKSYFGPRMASSREGRVAYGWNLTPRRLVTLLLVFCLVGNLLALLHCVTADPFLIVGLLLVACVVLSRLLGELVRVTRSQAVAGNRPETLEIMGARFWARGEEALLQRLEHQIQRGDRLFLVTPDSLALLRSLSDPDYRQALQVADHRLPDGAGVVWAADFLHEEPILDRIPGVEFLDRLAGLATRTGRSVYLLGAAPGVAEAAGRELVRCHPGLQIAGVRDGYFRPDDEPAIVKDIVATGAGFLFVGLGVPQQELWISRNFQELGVVLAMGVGGAFDVISGQKFRAPPHIQALGLEWLYRVAREPQRLPRILHLPVFVLEILKVKLGLPAPS